MKRLATVTVLLAVAAAAMLAMGAGSDGGDYKVRAIFDNAGFIITGEDVKVAGVKVGRVESLDVTRDFKAVVVLAIDDPGYQDFRSDASCQIRPQSLIGEKFVECTPTQKRAVDAAAPPPLKQIEKGKGEGQYLLPVGNTSKAVDLDLINNIMRLPYRQRLSLIVAELGTGVAGRGSELKQVIRRADPALKEVDKVLALLASQNKVLSDLARDSDTALAPLARERGHVSSFIEESSEVAQATAERSSDLEADIERLPPFLRELKPTMRRIGGLSDEMTPVLSDLGDVAPDVNRMIQRSRPVLEGRHPRARVARRGRRDRHPGDARRPPDRQGPAPLRQGLQAGGQDRPAGARVLREGPRHPAPARLRLLPGGRDQRLRQLRPLPAGAPDPQHLLALLHARRRRLRGQVRRERRAVVGRQRERRLRGQRGPDPPAHLRRARRQGPRHRRPGAHTAPQQGDQEQARHAQPGYGGSTGGRRGARWGLRATRPTPATSGWCEAEATGPLLDYLFGKDSG